MAGDDSSLIAKPITSDEIRDYKARITALWSEDLESAESLQRECILRVLTTIAKRRSVAPSFLAAAALELFHE